AARVELLEELARQAQRLRRDEEELVVEVRERLDERVDRAAVLEVADEGDLEVVEAAAPLPDRVEVEQRLRRMLVGAVAGVDDRLLGALGREAGRALARVADEHDVAVVLDHAD